MPPLLEVEKRWRKSCLPEFQDELNGVIFSAQFITQAGNAINVLPRRFRKSWLQSLAQTRDLLHTGAHKVNNTAWPGTAGKNAWARQP